MLLLCSMFYCCKRSSNIEFEKSVCHVKCQPKFRKNKIEIDPELKFISGIDSLGVYGQSFNLWGKPSQLNSKMKCFLAGDTLNIQSFLGRLSLLQLKIVIKGDSFISYTQFDPDDGSPTKYVAYYERLKLNQKHYVKGDVIIGEYKFVGMDATDSSIIYSVPLIIDGKFKIKIGE